MGRFFNLEAGVVGLLLFGSGFAVALFGFHFSPAIAAAVGGGVFAIGFVPVSVWAQDKLVLTYSARGMFARALELAILIRDSAPTGGMRTVASIDVALIHLARGDFENALRNLRSTTPSKLPPKTKAVVLGHTAYCLAHLGRELETAEAYAEVAHNEVPGEWAFAYFLGLVRLKRGKAAEALPLIKKSLETDPDPTSPLPGERDYILAQALVATGDKDGATAALGRASKATGQFGDRARKESSGAAPAGTA